VERRKSACFFFSIAVVPGELYIIIKIMMDFVFINNIRIEVRVLEVTKSKKIYFLSERWEKNRFLLSCRLIKSLYKYK
jgi:hypothetical protein